MIAIPKLLLFWSVFFFLVWALLLLFKPRYTMGIIEKLVKNTELSFLFGIILFVISFFYFLVHVTLDGTRYMFFSILWYLYVLKWIAMICFPSVWATNAKRIYGTVSMTRIMWIVMLLVTLFTLWVALVKI